MKKENKQKLEKHLKNKKYPQPIPKVAPTTLENKIQAIEYGKDYYLEVEDQENEE